MTFGVDLDHSCRMNKHLRALLYGFLFLSAAVTRPVLAGGAGTLVYPRADHAATLLNSGQVLLCGGHIFQDGIGIIATNKAEIYTPARKMWRATTAMTAARIAPGIVVLPDGRVLVAGGGGETTTNTAEIYDPTTRRWTMTGSMNEERDAPLILLPTGKVLIAGGSRDVVTCELYDPATGTWSFTGRLQHKRSFRVTLLANGQVLASGGVGGPLQKPIPQSEVYDPAAGNWSDTGPDQMPRYGHQQLLLMDGRVLVAGGEIGHSADAMVIGSSETYDPATGLWNIVGSLAVGRDSFSANLLGNGKVLAAGGLDNSDQSVSSTEEFDPSTNQWSTPPFALAGPRYNHTGTTLLDGSVLIAGGYGSGFGIFPAEAEVFSEP